MGLFRSVGKGAGGLFGKVVGGTVRVGGEITGSKYIKEIGDGIEQASTFAGDSVGQAADGVWNTASGMVQNDEEKINRGVDDVGDSVGRTAKGIGTTITNTVEQGKGVYDGWKAGDHESVKENLKGIGKTAAVGTLAVGLFDVVDGADGVQGSDNAGTQVVSTDTTTSNPGTHHVEPHYVEGHYRDGTYIDGYWRDGDGDTSVNRTAEDGGGYTRTNPDGDPTNNMG